MAIDAEAPELIKALDAQLKACPSWIAQAGTTHYPKADADTDFPFAVVEIDGDTRWRKIAIGMDALPSGDGLIVIHMDSETTNTAQIEKLAESIARELTNLETGLPCQASAGKHYDIRPGDKDAGGITIPIFVTFGLEG
jgi:hypothetical protein